VPDARFLACGVYQAELAALAKAPNVAVELSSVESGDALANALAVIGPERLLLGTHAPVYEPAPGVAKVAGAVHDSVAAHVGWKNAKAFFDGALPHR
jgi:predicted TIM-barrel fold metal-dependent hydrolase